MNWILELPWGLIFACLGMGFALASIGATVMFQRANYLQRKKLNYTLMANQYNLAEIERVKIEEPDRLNNLFLEELALNHFAVDYVDTDLKNIFKWKLDYLVLDRERYNKVVAFHERRLSTLQ